MIAFVLLAMYRCFFYENIKASNVNVKVGESTIHLLCNR